MSTTRSAEEHSAAAEPARGAPGGRPQGGGPGGGQDAGPPDPNRWKALAVCLVAGFMTLLDVSIVNVALPSIRTGIGAGENALQWIVSGYALTFGLMLVPAGRIGDARGRRAVFMVGVWLFILSSAVCGLAPGGAVLVVARLVQGLAGGLITPQVSGLIQSLFRGPERGKAFGWFGTTVGLSTAVGPLVGGALIAGFGTGTGWRVVFFVNVPIGLVALVLARRYLPRDPRTERGRTPLDPLGVLLLGLAVVCLLVPFIEQQTWHSPLRPLLFPLAALLLVLWVLHERRYGRHSEPVVNLELFRIQSYSTGAALGLLYFAGFTGVFFAYTQYLQNGLRYSALQAGLAATSFAVGSAGMAAVGSRWVLRFGRRVVAIGLVLVLVGLAGTWVAVLQVPGAGVGWAAAGPLLLAGLGSGLIIAPNQTLTLSQVPVVRAGSAGGVLQTGQRIGSAAGIAVTGSVFYGAISSSHGDFAAAFRDSLIIVEAFVLAAGVLAVVDILVAKRHAPDGGHHHGRHDSHTDAHRGGHHGRHEATGA